MDAAIAYTEPKQRMKTKYHINTSVIAPISIKFEAREAVDEVGAIESFPRFDSIY
jgi:hypothetical protein